MEQVVWLLFGASVFFSLIFVHELGHYLYGRFFVGIPKDTIKIVMGAWPQYVALRATTNNEWVSPASPDYQAAYRYFDKDLNKVGLFIASGYFFALLVLITVCSALAIAGIDPVRILRISALLNGAIILLDIAAIMAKKHTGDISHLWTISKWHAVFTVFVVVIGHILAMWLM